MTNFTIRGALTFGFTLALLLFSVSSHATIIASIDQFTVDKNGSNIFTDNFDNGMTPSQEPTNYNVQGAFPDGAESGGQLTLNSDNGEIVNNAAGGVRQNQHATYKTNIDPMRPNAGLNSGSNFDVTGTFNLVTPNSGLNNGYGVRFVDALQGQMSTDRALELNVQFFEPLGMNVIRFLLQDFANNTISTLGVEAYDPQMADQILLKISHSLTDNNFNASYAFGTGGTFDQFTQFGNPGALFTNTNFVRAQFQVFTALPAKIPEPTTFALLGIGLLGLLIPHRRKS